jgi:YD repeat-containing protein
VAKFLEMKNIGFLLLGLVTLLTSCQPEPMRKVVPFDLYSQYEGPVKTVIHKVAQSKTDTPKPIIIENYDSLGRLVSRVFPAGGKMEVTYDTMDNAQCKSYVGEDTIINNFKFGYDSLMRVNTVISHNDSVGLTVYEYDYDLNGYINYSKTAGEKGGIEIKYNRDKYGYVLSSEMNDAIKNEYYYRGRKLVRQIVYDIESGKRISVMTYREKLNDYGDVIEKWTWDNKTLVGIEYFEYTYY